MSSERRDTDRVVVGFDGDGARDALTFGVAWARATGDRLSVVTVHPGQVPGGLGRTDAEWAAYVREEAESLLASAAEHVPQGIDAEYLRVDSGSAAHGLSDAVEPGQDDGSPVLVVGSRRRRDRRRTFPGSTGNRLLHGAGAPVVVVPWGYHAEASPTVGRVVVGFVDTPDGHEAVHWAARVAAHIGGSLRVVTVVPDTQVANMGSSRAYADQVRGDYQQSLEGALAEAREVIGAEGAVSGDVVSGSVIDTLTDLAPAEADLLVVGSRGYGPVRRVLLGGVAHDVVRHSRIPVLVAPRSAG